MMSTEGLIETRDLSKIYRKGVVQVPALQDVSLTVRRGEFIAIMGPSGSGKSTLLNLLGCLNRPTDGSYHLDGQDVSQLSEHELAHIRGHGIGFVFQTFNLLPRLSALRNVELPALYQGQRSTRRQRARAVLERVGLGQRLNHLPAELSGGECQRVAVARALMNDPSLILADEPTGNLDSGTGAEILDLLCELHDEGRTIVMVTHDDEIARRAERIVRLRDGRLIQGESLA